LQIIESQGIKISQHLIRIQAVNFIDHHMAGFARFAHQVGYQTVSVDQAVLCIDQENQLIRFFHGEPGLLRHQVVQILLFATEAAGIDDDKRFVGALANAVLTIAG
jgi:hypothetical protein